MTVMEQEQQQQSDDFSNVTWSEHVHEQTSRSVPEAEEPGHDLNAPGTGLERDAPSLGNERLDCTVDTPIKENDGTKDAFVSYLITTHVCNQSSLDLFLY